MKKSIRTFGIWAVALAVSVLAFTGGSPAFAQGLDANTLSGLAFGGLVVNQATLQAAQTSFQTLFQKAFDKISPTYRSIAMVIPSTTAANSYKWLGQLHGIRKWLGDKVVNNLIAHGYFLENEDYELTVAVKRNDIEDDQLGIYNPLFSNIGDAAARHPDELTWPAAVAGFTTGMGFDKVPFFNAAHPVNGIDAQDGTYANRPAVLGAGEPWFLMDDTRPIQPIIFQERKGYHFVSQTDPQSPEVFKRAVFMYGVEARVAVGYGLPQLIYGSREPLTAAAYEAARLALSSQKRVDGKTPLGINGTKLIIGEGNFKAANIIINNERDANGATNPWMGTAKVEKIDHLTGM
jgi:phage major head subunit gpT-like protein